MHSQNSYKCSTSTISSSQNSSMSKSPPRRKTAIVHPLGFPKQRSTSFQRGAEENFSSLPSQRTSFVKPKEGKPLRKSKSVQITSFKHNPNTTSPIVKVVPDDKEDIVTGSNNNENVDIENNQIGFTGSNSTVKPALFTKPLLDIIDDLCSGASSNCDRKKLNQEKRRKSLSKERTIGIQQFFKYSSIWGDIKEL